MGGSTTLRYILYGEHKGDGAKKAEKGLDGVAKAVKKLVAGYATLKAAQAAIDMTKLGAQAERQEEALGSLAAAAGESSSAIINSIQQASQYTIDQMTAMQVANKAMVMDVAKTPEQFERLVKVAQRLGQAMGKDAASSIDDFITAGARQSRMIADNLGLVVGVEQATKNYATTLGKTAEELTDAERKQAFLNEMLVQGEAKVEEMGEASLDAAGNFESLTAAVKDAKVELGKLLLDFVEMTGVIGGLLTSAKQLRFERLAGEMEELGLATHDEVKQMRAYIYEGTRQLSRDEAQAVMTARLTELIDDMNASMGHYEESLLAINAEAREFRDVTRDNADAHDEAVRAITRHKMEVDRLAAVDQDLIWTLRQETITQQTLEDEMAGREAALEKQREGVEALRQAEQAYYQMVQNLGLAAYSSVQGHIDDIMAARTTLAEQEALPIWERDADAAEEAQGRIDEATKAITESYKTMVFEGLFEAQLKAGEFTAEMGEIAVGLGIMSEEEAAMLEEAATITQTLETAMTDFQEEMDSLSPEQLNYFIDLIASGNPYSITGAIRLAKERFPDLEDAAKDDLKPALEELDEPILTFEEDVTRAFDDAVVHVGEVDDEVGYLQDSLDNLVRDEYVVRIRLATSGALPDVNFPTYQMGAWNVPQTGPAMLHAGEMVVPRPQAEQLRSGGGAFGGRVTNYTRYNTFLVQDPSLAAVIAYAGKRERQTEMAERF